MRVLNEKVECADGFTMSVQANETAYCDPRDDDAESYTSAEVGFPSHDEPLLADWAEDPADPTGTIYAWVPRQVILNVIAKHGGIVAGELPAGFPVLRAQP